MKKFVDPKIEFIRFCDQDVITTSTFSAKGTYEDIWNVFNVSVN